MKVLRAIDGFFAWLMHWPLVFLCRLTGKSNFFFARIAIVLSVLGLIAAEIDSIVTDPSVFEAIWALFFLCLWSVVGLALWTLSILVESFTQAQTEGAVSPLTSQAMGIRVFFASSLLLDLAFGLPVWAVLFDPLVWMALSMYWLYDFQPPCKTWLRRGLEGMVSWAKGLRPTPGMIPRPHGA